MPENHPPDKNAPSHVTTGPETNQQIPLSTDKNSRSGDVSKTDANSHSTSEKENKRRPQTLNSLLDVLRFLCAYHKQPFSPATAIQGLASEGSLGQSTQNDLLGVKLFVDAAANVGLRAKLIERKPSTVPTLVYPFVILFNSGEAGIVHSKNTDTQHVKISIPGFKAKVISVDELDRISQSTVIYVSSDHNDIESMFKLDQHHAGHWLWSVAGKHWRNWLNVALSALVINLLGLALPLFVMNVYDRVIPNNSISTLWALAIGVMIALSFDFLLRMLRAVVIDNSGRRIDMKVSSTLFRQALDVKMASRSGRAGDLANQIREFESVRDFFTSASLSSLIDLFFIGVFLVFLWLIVGPLAIVPMLAVPIVVLVTLLIQIPLAKSVAEAQRTTSNRHSILVESLVGIETVKAISAEGVLQARWDDAVAGSVRASSATKFWSSMAMFFTMFIQQFVSVAIIVLGVFLVADNAITIGALIASNILAGRVLAPLGGIAMTIARAQQSFASLKQLNHLMKLEGDHKDQLRTGAIVANSAMQIKNVGFAYPGHKSSALEISDITIMPGERVGIIGRVGSGKSTLGKLACGMYQAQSGEIILGENEIGQYSMADLRRAVYYVGQESELFTGTLQENILITETYEETKFRNAVTISGVAAFAQPHPHGYDMQVGERGKNLSGGQRQAVALARAMMKTPSILYLDEPTSAMDNLSEAALVNGFSNWLNSDTTLIIATHRHSLLALVDRIIILDKGKLIADGPRDGILKKLKEKKPVQKKQAGKS